MDVHPAFGLGPLQSPADFALAWRYRLPMPETPRTLLVLCHGVGAQETSLAELAAAVDADTLVVLARAPLTLAPGHYAWFRVAFTAAGPRIDAAEAEASRQTLIRFIGQLQRWHGIAPSRTAVAGFSQGGIVGASVALSAPETVGAFAILSGRILPELQPQLATPERLARLHGYVAHGDYDDKLPPLWAERASQTLAGLGVACRRRRYPCGHELSAAMRGDFVAWLRETFAASSRGCAAGQGCATG